MKHLILGNGNLGKDLFLEINSRRFGDPILLSKSKGLDIEDTKALIDALAKHNPDVVWYCVGGGSVVECKKDSPIYKRSKYLNLIAPLILAEALPKHVKLILFSTDYAADETRPSSQFAQSQNPRSEYALMKIQMERALMEMQRPFTSIIRVGSLYGVHKPHKTFPGKIIQNYGFNSDKLDLPSNVVVPTPTRWIAGVLVNNFEKICPDWGTTIENVGPSGGITVKDWAKFVLNGFRLSDAINWGRDFMDNERPHFSGLKNSLEPLQVHWFDLWKIYFQPSWFTPKSRRAEMPHATLMMKAQSIDSLEEPTQAHLQS